VNVTQYEKFYIRKSFHRRYNYITNRYDIPIGYGLFAAVDIEAGINLCFFKGTVITIAYANKLVSVNDAIYVVRINDDFCLDCRELCKQRVCYASYINHYDSIMNFGGDNSRPQPNARIELDYYNGMPKVVSIVKIMKDKEIFINYGKDYKF
jgi:hypothetical protein